jgi:hypothetical protein
LQRKSEKSSLRLLSFLGLSPVPLETDLTVNRMRRERKAAQTGNDSGDSSAKPKPKKKKKKGKKVRSSNVAPATSPEQTEDEERILVEIPVKRKPRG